MVPHLCYTPSALDPCDSSVTSPSLHCHSSVSALLLPLLTPFCTPLVTSHSSPMSPPLTPFSPSRQAILDFYADMGLTQEQVEQRPELVDTLVSYHIIPLVQANMTLAELNLSDDPDLPTLARSAKPGYTLHFWVQRRGKNETDRPAAAAAAVAAAAGDDGGAERGEGEATGAAKGTKGAASAAGASNSNSRNSSSVVVYVQDAQGNTAEVMGPGLSAGNLTVFKVGRVLLNGGCTTACLCLLA